MSTLTFAKGHGTKNDFVLIADPDARHDLTPEAVIGLCDRRTGIGADGLLRVVRSEALPEAAAMAADAEWFMDYRNPDGTVAQMCGNGIRVFARHLVDTGLAKPGTIPIATRAGVRLVHITADPDGEVSVDMGRPALPGPDGIKVSVGPRSWPALHVDTGNPHAVVLVDDLAHAGDLLTPPLVDPVGAYPHGVTVDFVAARGPAHLALRVHERGVGETRSCGTGACAAVTAARHHAHHPPADHYTVDVAGGRLRITVQPGGAMRLTGPAVLVARGTADLDRITRPRPHRTPPQPS
ncbi:diaminopimelate epimerase [Kitasatospora sp. NPDC052868]|uniref:diaminopimelate epimerase n=1 Tax=Kitasatospora sp. NPDC052868 TaxID=3364060 RepID=UPI0037C75EA4